MARRKRKSLDWFVAATYEGCEREACKELRRAGFEAEYPMTRLPRTLNGERRVIALFPGYVFVRSSDSWKHIASTRGVVRLLMNEGCPSRVLDVDVQFFLSGSVDANGYFVDPSTRVFKVGDIVRPRSGRFAGIGGELTRMMDHARCEVIYWMMGNRLASTHRMTDLA